LSDDPPKPPPPNIDIIIENVGTYFETGDRSYLRCLPPWKDEAAVTALFRDEEMREWSSNWPRFDDDPPPRTGKRGFPKMSRAEKEQQHPTHRAAAMVAGVKFILADLYPEQRRTKQMNVTARAYRVVQSMTGVPANTLKNYIRRKKTDRRRIV
jgi:hypothetical protein